jgi:hypothetical protein
LFIGFPARGTSRDASDDGSWTKGRHSNARSRALEEVPAAPDGVNRHPVEWLKKSIFD